MRPPPKNWLIGAYALTGAPMDKVWVFADYKQAEAMVVAWAGPVPQLVSWFRSGEDIHTNVARMIAKVSQENRLNLPGGLFLGKHWSEYTKGDAERQLAKNTVHANNYGMGKRKFALITGLPERYAAVVQEVYFGLFPEIRSGYQAWIDDQLRRNRTITLPQGWPIQFYDMFGPELSRTAYSLYAQSTVGLLITRALVGVAEHFRVSGAPPGLSEESLRTPSYIRGGGLDVRLQIHDALGVSVPNSPETIDLACALLKLYGEQTIVVRGEPLVIPMDFKVGASWGDAKDYVPRPLLVA